jgi:hypothetical protein
MNEIYHQGDVQCLKNFITQKNEFDQLTNAQALGLDKYDLIDWNDKQDWVEKLYGVEWNNHKPKRIISLKWIDLQKIVGILTLIDCHELLLLDCGFNQLQQLNIINCYELFHVDCDNNRIDSLNVTTCSNLRSLYCSNNLIKKLDLTNNEKLVALFCDNNKLTKLNLQHNTQLHTLFCGNYTPIVQNSTQPHNHFITLNLTNNKKLTQLNYDYAITSDKVLLSTNN